MNAAPPDPNQDPSLGQVLGNILIVDDTPDNLRLLSKMLTDQGYRVRSALNGEMALKTLMMAIPDVMLLDINMPNMNGYEVCQRVKANPATAAIPIIFISALDEVLDKVKAFEVGGVDYITKPFQMEEVLVRVKTHLSLQREMQRRQAAEAIAREKERYLQLVLDNIPQKVFWKDRDFVFRGCNRQWAKFIDLDDPGVMLGKTDYDILPQKDADFYRAQDEQVLKEKEPLLHIADFKRRTTEGEDVWLDVNKIPIHDEENEVVGVLGVIEDITQRTLPEAALRLEQEKTENLLANILPVKIAKRLKTTMQPIGDAYENVTILFADIVGFTKLAAQIAPGDLIHLLNDIFSHFDTLVDRHQLEKIKTIGDAYMVAGGIPLPREDHAPAIAELALEMQRAIGQFQQPDGTPFSLRIGINSGPVVAGVIGLKKFSYDLWGDAVNLASRMEFHGEPQRIQVTEHTYALLKDRYRFEARGEIAVKGKGDIATYWLLDRLDS